MPVRRQQFVILSPFFYPEPISTGKYNSYLAQALVERGHQVTVVCSHPVYPSWRPQPSSVSLPGVHIIRGGANVRYPHRSILRRAVLELWFAHFVWGRESTPSSTPSFTSCLRQCSVWQPRFVIRGLVMWVSCTTCNTSMHRPTNWQACGRLSLLSKRGYFVDSIFSCSYLKQCASARRWTTNSTSVAPGSSIHSRTYPQRVVNATVSRA